MSKFCSVIANRYLLIKYSVKYNCKIYYLTVYKPFIGTRVKH